MAAAGYDNPFNLAEDLVFVKRGQITSGETALYFCAIVMFHKFVDLLKPL